jgi:hypothetical protein
MLGALGALSATGPAEVVVHALGWRGLFAVLAAASALVALLILLVAPERDQARSAASSPKISFLAIFGDARFVRIAPLAAIGIGTSFSLQGLWAAPWLTDVAGLDRPAVVEHLTLMAAALAASALALGALAERLRRAGISTEMFLASTLALSMAAQLALLLDLPVPSPVCRNRLRPRHQRSQIRDPCAVFPQGGRGPRQRRPRCAQHGCRVLSAVPLRLHHRPVARRRRTLSRSGTRGGHVRRPQSASDGAWRVLRTQAPPEARSHGARCRQGAWFRSGAIADRSPVYASGTFQADLARRQRAAWAFAAAASAALCVGLAATLLITISRPAIAFHVIQVAEPGAPSSRAAHELQTATGAHTGRPACGPKTLAKLTPAVRREFWAEPRIPHSFQFHRFAHSLRIPRFRSPKTPARGPLRPPQLDRLRAGIARQVGAAAPVAARQCHHSRGQRTAQRSLSVRSMGIGPARAREDR